jgi:hypothetical protein
VDPFAQIAPLRRKICLLSEQQRGSVSDKPIVKLFPTRWGVLANEKLQLAGPIGVAAAVACAECGAHALAYWPSSPLLWFVDLEIFRPLQYSFAPSFERLAFGDLAGTVCVVAPLITLIGLGLISGHRFPLAVASNLSFLFSAALLYGSYVAERSAATAAYDLSALCAPSFILGLSILLTALVSSVMSHRAYWQEILS